MAPTLLASNLSASLPTWSTLASPLLRPLHHDTPSAITNTWVHHIGAQFVLYTESRSFKMCPITLCALCLCLMLSSVASWHVRSMPAISALDRLSEVDIEIRSSGGIESVLGSASEAQKMCLRVICAEGSKSLHVAVYVSHLTMDESCLRGKVSGLPDYTGARRVMISVGDMH